MPLNPCPQQDSRFQLEQANAINVVADCWHLQTDQAGLPLAGIGSMIVVVKGYAIVTARAPPAGGVGLDFGPPLDDSMGVHLP